MVYHWFSHLAPDLNLDPALFFSGFSRCQQKDTFLLTVGTFTLVVKGNKLLKVVNNEVGREADKMY